MCYDDDFDAPRPGDQIHCGPSGFEHVTSVLERVESTLAPATGDDPGDDGETADLPDPEYIVETERGQTLRVSRSRLYQWDCCGVEPSR